MTRPRALGVSLNVARSREQLSSIVATLLRQVEMSTKLVRPAARAPNPANPARQLVDFVPEQVLMGYLDVHKMM
ncbi:hypothetical protein NECAME_18282 [Necator americanus]|uniref:Uncharacterized protein n=1 Tax=Necator americanus TaxID=51031 RepID=W2SV53_NECAM|nr:hypothetical protein NECAME_18282 [Necator americanus]ETN73515.1 hypothetical protein NECAME_18282 [Necator americanus]